MLLFSASFFPAEVESSPLPVEVVFSVSPEVLRVPVRLGFPLEHIFCRRGFGVMDFGPALWGRAYSPLTYL